MRLKNTYFFLVILALFSTACKSSTNNTKPTTIVVKKDTTLQVGAQQIKELTSLLKGKKVGIIANQSSIIPNLNKNKQVHLVDSLQQLGMQIVKVFSPEHGFRGKADAGEKVIDGMDSRTGLPIISLYGSNKKPKKKQLKGLDILVFDLQDVGVRFYTYISTLHYVMEAAAENDIPLIVLDRPNPNAHYVDGPVLEEGFHSFVGMHPVPIVYGMTIGEYAQMINGEKWLQHGIQCKLTVIPLQNYTHRTPYILPVKPSPNLPNAKAVELYPSLCFFEGTSISCGRGTDKQFQIFGSPLLPKERFSYTFTPKPNQGAKHPKHEDLLCYGLDLSKKEVYKINLQWLLDTYTAYPKKTEFFNSFFEKLAGTNQLQNQIELGYTHRDIRKTWLPELEKFKKTRVKYLLYD
jgi:uncharacterized protein YbbC (DUF1343 family)